MLVLVLPTPTPSDGWFHLVYLCVATHVLAELAPNTWGLASVPPSLPLVMRRLSFLCLVSGMEIRNILESKLACNTTDAEGLDSGNQSGQFVSSDSVPIVNSLNGWPKQLCLVLEPVCILSRVWAFTHLPSVPLALATETLQKS